jgi:four helix bundle protein
VGGRPHKNLEVWKESIDLVQKLYKLLENFPSEEKYGIISQLKRAAISVPSNIAEGAARRTDKEMYQFLSIAAGSLSEIDTLIEISKKLELLGTKEYKILYDKVEKIDALLRGLMKSIKIKINS